MKKIFLILFISLLSPICIYADVMTDKLMAKIARDTKMYISADARAATEQEAYDLAMTKLTELVADYLKKTTDSSLLPDAIYLSQLSGIYERLTNQISEDRYRVMLYVKKSDIKPVSNSSGAIVLSKNEDDAYITIPTTPSPQTEPIVITDTVTVIKVIEKPLDPTLSLIASKKTKDDITSTIQSLVQSNNLSGGAKFPINKYNDFYVAVIGLDNNVIAILHYNKGLWKLVPSGEEADLDKYAGCLAYWFTLSSN